MMWGRIGNVLMRRGLRWDKLAAERVFDVDSLGRRRIFGVFSVLYCRVRGVGWPYHDVRR